MEIQLNYYKWNYKRINKLKNTCKINLDINNIQIYYPILSLYFHIHNTKNSKNIIDISRRYYLNEIVKKIDDSYSNSNCIFLSKIYDYKLNKIEYKKIFCKCIPLLDPIHFIMNHYSNNKSNILLPNNYVYNTQSKINNMNNSSYIDVFFSYIGSQLTNNNILPNFCKYYGSVNGIKNKFKIDITDEYYELNNEKWFDKNINNLFTLNLYTDDLSCRSDSINSNNSNTSSNLDEYICELNNFPVQYLFIEKLEGTLEDFLENINQNILISCLFQINYALCYLQKYFDFTHNDLHINNIMYLKTNKMFLYYKYNNIYFKVPTFGYIFKIIDFGRAIFKFKNKCFYNDVFSKYGEAEGQYSYPIPSVQLYTNNKYENNIKPNYSFDMCRLSTTILDEIYNKINHNSELFIFLNNIVIDKNNNNIFINKVDNFDLYINIAKNACNGIPNKLILNDIFKNFRIKKKIFPKHGYYKC